MEVIAEVPVPRSREALLERALETARYADSLDLPEAPMGRPTAHSIAAAHLVMEEIGIEAVAHIRLADLNWVAFESVMGAARMLGVRRVVALRGDPPVRGTTVGDVDTETAVRYGKSLGLSMGALISLRRGERDVLARASIGADFFLVLRYAGQKEILRKLCDKARIYPYLLVATPRNVQFLEGLGQPYMTIAELPKAVKELAGTVHGVVISVPRDHHALLEALKTVRENL